MESSTAPALCECGCGQLAPLAKRTRGKLGHVKGQPVRFVKGHGRRRSAAPENPRLCACGCRGLTTVHRGVARAFIRGHNSPTRTVNADDWLIEDHGYSTPCWIWQHSLLDGGRGRVTIRGRPLRPYQAVWIQSGRELPAELVLHHHCEQPACVNPEHLSPMTQSEHMQLHHAT